MHQVYIALGSNLANPIQQLCQALASLIQLPNTQLQKISPFYQSSPLGPQDQPDFINAVVYLETQLEPQDLLSKLQKIEIQQGRMRLRHWGERTLDLDILLIDDLIIDLPNLQVPHYAMHEREFVIVPLADIAPDLSLPTGENIQQLRQKFANHSMQIIHHYLMPVK